MLTIFSDIAHDKMVIFMDDFTTYGETFYQALQNLETVLKRCTKNNLSLRNDKYFMMMT